MKAKLRLLTAALLAGAALATAAQAQLPPEARMQVLILQADEAQKRGDNARALELFKEMDGISGAQRPAATLFIEGALAGQAQDWGRAMNALEAYFRVADSSHPDYQQAVRMYSAAEPHKREADRIAAAEAEAARARAAAEQAQREAEAQAQQALREEEAARLRVQIADENRARSAQIAAAARISADIAARTFRDKLDDGEEGPELIAIPPGSFMMGSPRGEKGRYKNEGPQRQVTINYAFAVGKYEVSLNQYKQCVAERACRGTQFSRIGSISENQTLRGLISWFDAQKYVSWLSARTGVTYRLLSEAEWEYAARAGSVTPYHTGNDISDSHAVFGVGRNIYLAYSGRAPNAFGLHDMVGNILEWVQDCYEGSYDKGQPSNGAAHERVGCSSRVQRGGYYNSGKEGVRSAVRSHQSPDTETNLIVGFRIARVLE